MVIGKWRPRQSDVHISHQILIRRACVASPRDTRARTAVKSKGGGRAVGGTAGGEVTAGRDDGGGGYIGSG